MVCSTQKLRAAWCRWTGLLGEQRALALESQLNRFREELSFRDKDMIQLSEAVRQLELEQLNTATAHTAVVQLLHSERELSAEISVRAQQSYAELTAERACGFAC